MLALCNLPKAAEANTEVTSNRFESWIQPSKTQRGISLLDLTWFVKDEFQASYESNENMEFFIF